MLFTENRDTLENTRVTGPPHGKLLVGSRYFKVSLHAKFKFVIPVSRSPHSDSSGVLSHVESVDDYVSSFSSSIHSMMSEQACCWSMREHHGKQGTSAESTWVGISHTVNRNSIV